MSKGMIAGCVLAVCAAWGMVSGVSAQPTVNETKLAYVSPNVLRAFESAAKYQTPPDAVRVIVTFNTAKGRGGVSNLAAIHNARASVLATLPAASHKVLAAFSHIPALSLTINRAALNALRAQPLVAAINEDREISMSMTEANALTDSGAVHSLGFTGEGGVVAIIDTGVDKAGGLVHASLADDVVGQACFRTEGDCIGGVTSAKDQDGHGTHVAGIITGPQGVAPDARFYALKVFTTGNTSDTNILNALNYVVSLNTATPGSVNVVNMSLGGDNYADQASCDADGAAYLNVFSSLNAQGVSVFVATGNDAQIGEVSSPACVTGAIGVGSTGDATFTKDFSTCTDSGAADRVSCYSNATPVQGPGELVDLLAPGCDITSTGLNGSTDYAICGTSMATPYAAGVAALLIDYLNTNALSMTPAQIETHMEATGLPVSDYRMPAGAPSFSRVSPPNMIGALEVDAPTGFNVTSTTSTSATMAWTAAAGVTEYRVYVSANDGTETLAGTVTAPTVTFTDTRAACGVLTYFVRAYDGAYESLPSNTDFDTARSCPVAPDNLALVAMDANTVELSWTDHNADETANILQRQVNGGGYVDYQTLSTGTNLQFTDHGLTCGKVYDYRAVSVRSGDRSAASNVIRHAGCAPTNDLFVGATLINSSPYTNNVAKAQYASTSVDDPVHSCRVTGAAIGSHSLWWTYTPAVNGKLNLDTLGSTGSMTDTLLSVYTGTLAALTAVACNDDISNSNYRSSINNLAVTGGTTYTVMVSRWNTTPTANVGAITLNASFAPSPGVTVTPTTVDVTEGGATDSYNVALLTAPTANVTINISNDTDCSVSTSALVFTAVNFSVAQSVTVTAVDDSNIEGSHSCGLAHGAVSADAAYQGIAIANVLGNVIDNDVTTYTLSLNTTGTGSGTVSGAGVYNAGNAATVSATANAGSTFSGWSGPNGVECASGSVVMNADKSCTATFTLNAATLINTGYRRPTANQRDGGGDGNGFEVSPTSAYSPDGVSAIDRNSGRNSSTSCGNAGKDRHRYFNYGLTIPAAAIINGLEVRLNAKADSSAGVPRICVQLSRDGGVTWTASALTPALGTTPAEYTLGSSTATWGRTWNAAHLSNANFRVRLINVSSSTARDFMLDRIAVRVTYQ